MTDKNFTDDGDFLQVLDALNKVEFFQGQRAGRDLWFDKPYEVQEQDLTDFNKSIQIVRDYLRRLKVEIEGLKIANEALYEVNKIQEAEIDGLQHKYDLAVAEREANVKGFTEAIAKVKSEAYTELAERLKTKLKDVARFETTGGTYYPIGEAFIDKIANELTGGKNDVPN